MLILLVLITCIACAPKESEEDELAEINDYFPAHKDTLLVYQGRGNEFAGRKVYFDFLSQDQVQLRSDSGGTVVAETLRIKEGELRRYHSQEGFYYWYQLDLQEDSDYEVLLKEPLIKGTSWTLNDGRERYISETNVKVTTPKAKFRALEVTTEGEEYKNIDYYVKEQGLVLSQHKSGEVVIETALKKVKQNSKISQQIKFFYPDFAAEEVKYVTRDVKWQTNDQPEEVLATYLKKTPAGLERVISPKTKIKHIKIDYDEKILRVDFSEELVTDMNAGHLLESLIVTSIVNTFGEYYQLDKVYLSVAGKPYQTGHMMIKEDEYFEVEDHLEEYQN